MRISSTDPFGQARLKMVWAEKNFREMHAIWQAFLETDFCKISVEPYPKGGGEGIRVTSVAQLPYEMIMLTGDIVHAMKCALDYTISEALGWKDTRLTFPMAEERQELVSSFQTQGLPACPTCKRGGKGTGRNSRIEVAHPGLADLIVDKIRPYKDGNTLLWILNKLDVRDKHRLLMPVVSIQKITGINARNDQYNRIVNGTVGVHPNGFCKGFALSGKITLESYDKPTAEVFFNETGLLEGQPLFETLINMSEAVSEAISAFEEFFAPK